MKPELTIGLLIEEAKIFCESTSAIPELYCIRAISRRLSQIYSRRLSQHQLKICVCLRHFICENLREMALKQFISNP